MEKAGENGLPRQRPRASGGAGSSEPVRPQAFIAAMSNPSSKPATNASNTEKDPSEWTTGDEPMTGAQKSYLKTLSDEAKEPFDDSLTKAEASRRIDELQQRTGRGTDRQSQK